MQFRLLHKLLHKLSETYFDRDQMVYSLDPHLEDLKL